MVSLPNVIITFDTSNEYLPGGRMKEVFVISVVMFGAALLILLIHTLAF